jgi:hypothetical protein
MLPATTTGCPAPAGKCRASTRSPATESGVPRNESALDSPLAFRPVSPSAITPSTSAVVTQVSLGRTAMARPTRAQPPRAVGSGEPKTGRAGQNTHRPQLTSSAGRRVSMASRATPTPMASTGPMPLVEFSSATTSASMARMTVPALARMAGPARRNAIAIASCRSA